VKILILAAHHVHELLGYRECADVMRQALADLARGRIEQPLRTIVRPQEAAGFMALMPSYSGDAGYGLKAICITPGNPAIGKDAHQGGVLLFAAATGEPLALVNASAVTEIRTAATSALATDLLARPGAAQLAIIGTGVQARAHARALAATRPLTGIRIAGRDLARTRQVAAGLAGQLGLPVSGYDAVADAVAGADIVVTATSSPHPVLQREWLSAGTHVNAVGACVPGDREIDTATMASAAIFADSRESVQNEAGDFLLAESQLAQSQLAGSQLAGSQLAQSQLAESQHVGAALTIRAELGELLTGTAAGRADDDEITLFESLGLAAEDLAAATYVYKQANQQGAGTRADF
jgi:ornithine cyclodeaminase/alanine dehydrogenase-like protein (mu-crystallin family)